MNLMKSTGLILLTKAGFEVRKAAGLRIGVLVIDDKAWVFSPTPEIIFDQPNEKTFNAVEVSHDFAQQILVSIAPEFSFSADPLESVACIVIIPLVQIAFSV
jgi:hypothetical protein